MRRDARERRDLLAGACARCNLPRALPSLPLLSAVRSLWHRWLALLGTPPTRGLGVAHVRMRPRRAHGRVLIPWLRKAGCTGRVCAAARLADARRPLRVRQGSGAAAAAAPRSSLAQVGGRLERLKLIRRYRVPLFSELLGVMGGGATCGAHGRQLRALHSD